MEKVIGILDGDNEHQRLELILTTDNEPQLALRLATYAEGLGWITQKTIPIDARQADQLQFLLGGARHLLKQAEQQNMRQQLAEATCNIATFVPAARKSA